MGAGSTLLGRVVFHPALCAGWKPHMESAVYQLAGLFLLLGFMGGSGPFGSIYTFGFLAVGFLCAALWGWLGACGLDVFGWNVALFLACALQLGFLLLRLRKPPFPEEFDQLYKQIWQPLRVPRRVYREIVQCCEGQVVPLAKEQTYALEGKTPIDRLSLLLDGRVRVSQDGQFLHYVFPYQFLDSPEWESLRPSEEGSFQVTLTAETECRLVSWPRRRLYLLLARERYVARLFAVLLGFDIAEKLFALNEKLFAKFGLRFDLRLPRLYHVLGPATPEGQAAREPAGRREEGEGEAPAPGPALQVPPAAAAPPPSPAPPLRAALAPAPTGRPRSAGPDGELSGEDSTSLALEDFAELTGSLVDYGSEGEYLK